MKISISKKPIKLLINNYKKILILLLIIFTLYNIYFLYQNFYFVLINPEPVDLTSFQQPTDNKTDKLYDALKEKMEIKEKSTLDLTGLKNPF